jgi:hypothetical protein
MPLCLYLYHHGHVMLAQSCSTPRGTSQLHQTMINAFTRMVSRLSCRADSDDTGMLSHDGWSSLQVVFTGYTAP